MATWQFDIHALPSAAVARVYGSTPLTISRADFDVQEWWKDVPAPKSFRADLAKLLPPLKSWNSNLEQWGHDDGNRIDVMWSDGAIADIFIRVDVRNLSHVFLVNLLDLVRKNHWLLRTQDERVFPPSLSKLLSSIGKSDAFRFVEDPRAFLDALESARQSELGEDTI